MIEAYLQIFAAFSKRLASRSANDDLTPEFPPRFLNATCFQ